MRIVFMGTPEFAVASLMTLYEAKQDVVLVVSQPDRPKGRGYNLTPSPVKTCAAEHGTRVITPQTLKDEETQNILREANADLFIVTAYGRILPEAVLAVPKLGCVNLHASLLPRLRGAAPINRAIMNGDTIGGVTVMFMDKGMDTGDMILQKSLCIPSDMDAGAYHDALAALGKTALTEFLALAEEGTIPRTAQDSSMATYAPKIENDDMLLTFDEPAASVCNRIRGLSPFPGAYCFINGRRIKIKKARLSDASGETATIISTNNGGIEVACLEGSVIITELCPEGKGICDAESFLRGNKIEIGTKINE